MGVLHIDSNPNTEQLRITGDIAQLLNSRRAVRFLKDNAKYTVSEDCMFVEIKDSLHKTMGRVETAAEYAKCEAVLSDSANEGVQAYMREEEKFSEFSSKALDIRNNRCDISEFSDFKNALIDSLPCRTLYPLQMLSAYHMAFAQNACNFSVPGAGKTSIVYGAYAYLKQLDADDKKKIDHLLIIGPLNAFGPWELEYQECFGRKAVVKRLSGKQSLEERKQYFYEDDAAEITLLSYASVPTLVDDIAYFLQKNRVMVVLDEAHKIKNTDGGIIARSIMALAEYCASRVVLTGTPAPNGYEDLYNLFKFIWPNKDIIKFHVGQLKDMSKSDADSRVGSLLNSIAPFFMRICKSDLSIPPATIHPPILVKMGPEQRRIYDFIEHKYILDIAENSDQRFKNELVQARLIRLMQAATNPMLLREPLKSFAEENGFTCDNIPEDAAVLREIAHYAENEIPAKYIAAAELIKKIINNGEKVVVWACYVKNIEWFSEYLDSQGIRSRCLYGATPIAGESISEEDEEYELTREAIVKEFHNPESEFKVIIANPFAVAESISLHKACHNAIYMERSFNAAHFLQSKDRIHRYGLPQGIHTNYYFLVSEDSIDLTIHERLELKEKRLLDIIESMPIPLFKNVSVDEGDEDVKAVLRDYARRIKKM